MEERQECKKCGSSFPTAVINEKFKTGVFKCPVCGARMVKPEVWLTYGDQTYTPLGKWLSMEEGAWWGVVRCDDDGSLSEVKVVGEPSDLDWLEPVPEARYIGALDSSCIYEPKFEIEDFGRSYDSVDEIMRDYQVDEDEGDEEDED